MKEVPTLSPSGFPGIEDENNAPLGGKQTDLASAEQQTNPPLPRITYLQDQMKANSRRDARLWTVAILLIIVLATSLVPVLIPGLVWKIVILEMKCDHLPQLIPGLILLITASFCIYATAEKQKIIATRADLIKELLDNERKQAFSLLDPVTQLLSYRTIDNIAEREIARANRLGSALTFVAITLDSISTLQKWHGTEASNRALLNGARLLKDTFRGSDAIFRLGPIQFLVLMPDTTEEEAESAIARLKSTAEALNADAQKGLCLSFSYGISPHIVGRDRATAAEQVRRCMFLLSQKANVF